MLPGNKFEPTLGCRKKKNNYEIVSLLGSELITDSPATGRKLKLVRLMDMGAFS